MRCGTALRGTTLIGLLVGSAGTGAAGEKASYSLFAPTPARLMREMTTDRPDTTETPFTVDAGHVQVESTIFGYTRSRPDVDGLASDSFDFAPSNVRIGLTNDAELSLVWQPYGLVQTDMPQGSGRQSGIGGLDIRAKLNLWGNDTFEKSHSALALLPFITLPTDRDNGISAAHVEGGLIVPLALKLPDKFGLGFNASVVWLKDDDAIDYHAEYTATASLAYDWTDRFGSYWEVVATFNTGDPRGDVVVVGGGLTYAATENLQLDAGINLGVTRSADLFNPFIGMSRRF